MAHLLSDLANYFNLDETNIDNWTFKLYYKVSMVICMTGATVGIASQYFGDPISCEFQGISSNVAQDYCWIHGSSYIKPEYQAHMKCIVDLDGVESADMAPDTSYYQWVTFMFAIQALIFFLPYKLWKGLEGGLMASFGTDGKSPVMMSEDALYDDGVVMEAVIEKFVKYFKSIFHHNSWYFASFIFCELLNFAFLFVQFFATDSFLNYKFRWYGWNVVQYYQFTAQQRNDPDLALHNPMCEVFPTITSCDIPNVGASGVAQVHNGMCVLTQNIVNEKIYLVLWFWYLFLGPVSILYLCYRLITLMFHGVRYSLLYRKVRRKYDVDIQRSLEFVLAKGQIGDWFVLYQLSKNCNPYFFREFIKELAKDMREKPKKSKSNAGSSTGGSVKKLKPLDVEMGAEMLSKYLGNSNDGSDDSDDESEAASSQALINERDPNTLSRKGGEKRNAKKSGKRK